MTEGKKPAPLFKAWVPMETRIEVLGKFFAQQEGRAEWATEDTPPEEVAGLTEPTAGRVADLGLVVLGHSPGRVAVVCPHCDGRRAATTDLVAKWHAAGRVPVCSVSKGKRASCEPIDQRRAA